MVYRIPAFILACAVFFLSSAQDSSFFSEEKLIIHFFGSRTCGECLEIKEGLLYPLEAEHSSRLDIRYHATEDEFDKMVAMEEEFNVPTTSAQELFLPDTFLLGYEEIMKHGQEMILARLADSTTWARSSSGSSGISPPNTGKREETIRNRLRFWYITGGGLVDGVNPCALATMVFFISVLAMQKRKRSEILIIGSSFTIAVYLTYLLLGLGLLNVITSLKQYRTVSEVIRWGTVAFAGTVALICFRDALKFKQTGKTEDIALQLPKPVKLRIHKIIQGNIGRRGLVAGALITGFLVTLFEAVCTGQVYIPIIAALSEPGLRTVGMAYLLYYNFLFVLPLIIVMILAYHGLKWNKLAKTTQKHIPMLKISLGVVLGFLAIYMAFFAH